MPVEFLSDVHLERYGRFQDEPTLFQIAEYFVLISRDQNAMVDLRLGVELAPSSTATRDIIVWFAPWHTVIRVDSTKNIWLDLRNSWAH